jgi:TolB-like protein
MSLLLATGSAMGQPRVGVMDFNTVGVEEPMGKGVSELICTELSANSSVRLVERAAMRRLMEERNLRGSDLADSVAAELGKLAGADSVLVGSLVKTGDKLTVATRLVRVQSGEVVLGRSVTVRSESDLPRVGRELADDIGRVGVGEAKLPPLPIEVVGKSALMPATGDEGAEAAAIVEGVRSWVELYGKLPKKLQELSREKQEGQRLTPEDEALLNGYGPWRDKMRRWPFIPLQKGFLIGDSLFVSWTTVVKNFALDDTIELELKKPGLRKRIRVKEFALEEKAHSDFSAQELRGLLSEVGFEILAPKKQPDGVVEVTVTYWVK